MTCRVLFLGSSGLSIVHNVLESKKMDTLLTAALEEIPSYFHLFYNIVVVIMLIMFISERKFSSAICLGVIAVVVNIATINMLDTEGDSQSVADRLNSVASFVGGLSLLSIALIVAVTVFFFVLIYSTIRSRKEFTERRPTSAHPVVNKSNGSSGSTTLSERLLSEALEKEKSIRSQYFNYVDSIELSLQYPLMRDTSDDLIIALNMALSDTTSLRPDTSSDDQSKKMYMESVKVLEQAFLKAEGTAKKIRDTNMSQPERAALGTARTLLNFVYDNCASDNERFVAYKKVLSIMDNLAIPATEKARLALESDSGVNLSIAK